MSDADFPKPVSEVISTLAELFRHQGRNEILEILESAHSRFDQTAFDNWNGGTYRWALRLEVPVALFATLEPRLALIEKEIIEKLGYIARLNPNHQIGEVTITPITPGASVLGQRMAPSELDVRRLWPSGRFRLFLSHVSEDKVAVSKLKDELTLCGVAAFVAHEDIEPSFEWRDEIELGLRSMHALAALLTRNFHASKWTDQEIGWALGRNALVVPVKLGEIPYGFSGKYQGVSGSLEQPQLLAASIAQALIANPQTHGEMKRSLVRAFSEADSYNMASTLCSLVVTVSDFTDDEKEALWKACNENRQVTDAWNVARAIYAKFGKPSEPKPTKVDQNIPF